MEKYGWAYAADVNLVKEALCDELEIFDEGNGTVRIRNCLGEYSVKIRDWEPPAPKMEQVAEATAVIQTAPQHREPYVSIWNVKR